MKKLLVLVLLVFLAFSGTLAAQETDDLDLEPLMAPGDLAITAGLGYGFFIGAIDVSGGVELMLSRVDIADTIPITFGVAGKAYYYRYSYDYTFTATDYHYTYLGGGGFATAHLGFKDLDLDESLEWLDNVDTYVGLGVGFYSYNDTYYSEYLNESYNTFQIQFQSTGGVNYFITPNVAINFEGGYYGGWGGGGLIGILVKL
jgi:hypothetical protein